MTHLMNGSLVPLAPTFAKGLKKLLLGKGALTLPSSHPDRFSKRSESHVQTSRIQHDFAPAVVDLLRQAGWWEGRDVLACLVLPPQYPLFPRAESVMSEFGCLYVGRCGAGIDCATSDIEFNLSATSHLAAEISAYQEEINARLYPLGEVHLRHGYMLIDEYGKTYLMNDSLLPLATTFDRGLENVLLGKSPGFDAM